MLLETNGTVYSLHFSHEKNGQGQWETRCVLHEGKCRVKDCAHNPDGAFRGFGLARCNPVDQFNKARGGTVSLTRALNTFTPVANHRELRKQIWSAYFKISPYA